MHRRLILLAGAAALAAGPALAQTEQQRAQAAQGQTPGQAGSPAAAAPALAKTDQPRARAAQGQPPGQAGSPAAAAPASTAGRAEVVTGQEFMRLASMSDRFEVASSRLAEQKAQQAEVKQFAGRMVQD